MNIALVGYGHMGKMCKEMSDEIKYICAKEEGANIKNLSEIKDNDVDVILDFSNPSSLDMIIEYSLTHKTPVIFATTGYSEEQEQKIENLSKVVPVLRSGNFSLGVILLNKLVKEITPILEGYDVEIIEAHHNRKIDAPSGTAKMLLNSVQESTHFDAKYGRYGNCKRTKNEIGVHSIRGGTIVGEHEVIYCGEDEILSIRHSAHSRKIFVTGALKACKFIIGKSPKLYDMEDVLFQKGE